MLISIFLIHVVQSLYLNTFPWPTTLQHFHGLPHYNISMAYHITIMCVFLWIPENVTLRDTFSYVHSMLSIDFIDAITSKVYYRF